MALRSITLSGYPQNAVNGKIVVNTDYLTCEAEVRTRNHQLSWADVRFLDNEFINSVSINGVSNLHYLRNSRIVNKKNSGHHLFSILTGLQLDSSRNSEYNKDFTNVNFPVVVEEESQLKLLDKTRRDWILPNPKHESRYGLYELMFSSDYGKLCENFSGNLAAYNLSGRSPARAINTYRKMIMNKETLCTQDKFDIFADCLLYVFSCTNENVEVLDSNQNAGYFYQFGDYKREDHPVKIKMRKLAKLQCNYKALDYARESLPNFANDFQISQSFDNNTFPDIQ